jgi:hypothetical protein
VAKTKSVWTFWEVIEVALAAVEIALAPDAAEPIAIFDWLI